MLQVKRGLLVLIALSFILALSVPDSNAASKQLWTYGTTSKASGFYALHVFFANMINKYVPEVGCTPIETGATVDNWRRMEKGEIQIGFCAAGADWQGHHGEGPFQGKPIKIGRVLFIDDYSTFNWVVHAESGLKSIYDLNGKRVNVGIAGSIGEELAIWALKSLTVSPKDTQRGSTSDAIESMQNRRLDAWVKGSANPDSAVVSLSANVPISILSFSEADLAKLHADRPYIGSYAVEANIYKGVPKFQTYGNYDGVLIRADIPQEIQYKIIKAVYEHWDEVITAFPQWKQYPDLLKLTAKEALVPLSAGTVQYLEEKGYTLPKQVIPPEYKKMK